MTYLLLINPTSGGGRGKTVGEKTRSILQQRGVRFTDISGTSYESARTNLRASLTIDCKGVIAIGGDGIVHCAIQELAGTTIPLAYIPAGTGNDFARAMSLPLDDVPRLLDEILGNAPIAVDLGQVNGEYFADILSTGFDSVVNERANRMKRIRGQLKYNIAILLELPLFKPLRYQFSIDGKSFESSAMLIAVANNPSYGGGMLVCPNADPMDGLFDIMILKPISKIEFLKVFPKVFSGTHINHPAVTMLRGRKVEISSNAIAYADGERIGPLPIVAKTIEKALWTWKLK